MGMYRASAAQAEVTLSIEVVCHHCQRPRERSDRALVDVFLVMDPGIDGVPWMLCGRCWLAYLKFEGNLAAIGGRVLELPVATTIEIAKPAPGPSARPPTP